jgi:hypothetical protein
MGVKVKMTCESCGNKENLLKAKNDLGEKVQICETCFESTCEGYEILE